MEEATGQNWSVHNIKLIVKDYIRTLKLPSVKSKKPLVILLVGIPASGKSYLAKNLVANLPLVLVSENDIQSFLVPKISFFERGQEVIGEFAKEVIKKLVKAAFSCIFDANLRSFGTREEFRQIIGKSGGQTVTVYFNCPKKAAYERIKKRNTKIIQGAYSGFPMDWDYFQYEINTTQPPQKTENAVKFDSSQSDHQLARLISYLKQKLA